MGDNVANLWLDVEVDGVLRLLPLSTADKDDAFLDPTFYYSSPSAATCIHLEVVFGLILVAFKGRLRKTLGNLGIIISSLGRGRAPYKETPELDVSSDKAMRLPHGALIAIGTLGFLAAAAIHFAPR